MNKTIENHNETEELLQLVTFKIDNEEFGIDILMVQEINKMINITKVPNSPHFVEGVVNLRGRIIPVVNLRKRLMFDTKETDKNTRIVVVEIRNQTIGFIVDEVCEVLRIPAGITQPPPDLVMGIDSKYITAVGKLENRLLILLDMEMIIGDENLAAA